VDPRSLVRHSTAVVGFWLAHCFGRPGMLHAPLDELFTMTLEGRLRPVVGGTYPLEEAARAHRDLRGRTTTGKLLLTP
jgi:NADPH2:quinone reductase